jgi:hypothetical protein
MEIRGWPSAYTVVRTAREIRSGEKRILSGTWVSIVPPVPAGLTESADDPFIINIRGVQIPVTRADIEEAPS